MKLLLTILACLVAASAGAQTVKSLGYNTTNGQIVYSGTNDLRFPATIRIGTNQSGFSSGGQFLTLTDAAGGVAMIIGTNAITSYDPIAFSSTGNAAATRTNLGLGATWLTNTDVTNFRTAIGLGVTNNVTFSNITASGIITAKDATVGTATNAATAQGIQWSGLGGAQHAAIYGAYDGVAEIALSVGTTSNALSDVATFRATGMTVNSNAVVGGTLAVTGNVTMSGVNNTMPNATTADSASSLMTRDLVAQRLPFQLINYDPVTSAMGAVTSSNGGSGTPSVNKFDLRGGTNTNGVAVWGAGSGGGLGIKSSSRGNVGWQGRVSVGWSISRILTNSEIRLQFGKDNSDRNFTALGARGVGIYISNSSVFFETHDGTNHFQTTNSLTTSGDSQNDSWMAVTSNGVASFYKNGTLITNVTNNVPNSQSSSAAFGYVIGVRNTTTNNSGIRIFTTPGFILQD